MKTTILLLCLLGTSLAFPLRQAERLLSASNSGEMLQLMRMYSMLGNHPEQTQQQVNPAHGMPPARLITDLTVQQVQQVHQQPHQFAPVDKVWRNVPMLPPLSMQPAFPHSQLPPSFNMVPMTRLMPQGQDLTTGNSPSGFMPYAQALPMNVGEMTVHHTMFPHPHHLFPIIITHMGQQGMLMSSEEMQFVPQVFAGVLMPPFGPGLPGLPGLPALPGLPVLPPLFQAALFPAGEAGVSQDEQEDAIPMGQAGTNTNNQAPSASTGPNVTPVPDTREELAVTVPAGVRKGVAEGSLARAGNGGLLQTYTPPAGLKQFPTDSVTDIMFVEPTGLATDMSPGDEKHPHSYRSHNQGSNGLVRGDDHLPLVAADIKSLRKHKKRRA